MKNKKVKIEFGGGLKKTPGYLNIEYEKGPSVDIVHDLNKFPYPFKSNSIDEIRAFHILEHLEKFEKTVDEIYRILKPGGKVHIKVPHFSSPAAFYELHNRFFWYYCFTSERLYYKGLNLQAKSMYDKYKTIYKRLNFEKKLLPYNYLVEPLVNLHPIFPVIYEHTFLRSLFPAKEIELILEKI